MQDNYPTVKIIRSRMNGRPIDASYQPSNETKQYLAVLFADMFTQDNSHNVENVAISQMTVSFRRAGK